MQREIKFRAWDKRVSKMYYGETDGWSWFSDVYMPPNNYGDSFLMQYTGLKDKNVLVEVYECDIIDSEGNIKGNIYENKEIYKEGTDWIVAGICTKDWRNSEEEIIKRGCRYAE